MSRPLHHGRSGGARHLFDQMCQPNNSSANGCGHELPGFGGIMRSRRKLMLFVFKLGVVLVTVFTLLGSFYWAVSFSASSRNSVYSNYRRLQEQLVTDLSDIGELALGVSKSKELEFCPEEYENYVPCYYNVSESLDSVDLEANIEYERRCSRGSSVGCLILPPTNYRIPLRWPNGRDVIWKENVRITGQEFSSGSLTKR